jgi:hypothetical protein
MRKTIKYCAMSISKTKCQNHYYLELFFIGNKTLQA